MGNKKKDSSLFDTIMEGMAYFSLRKVMDEVERRLKSKSRKIVGRIILTLAGLYLILIAVVFISISLVRLLSTVVGMNPAISWGAAGLVLALTGTILMILGRLVT